MGYTLEGLIDVNPSYHHEHRVTESDVQKANRIARVIESTRTDYAPRVGDIVQYTNKYGNYYAQAHIENMNEEGRWVICEQPMIPFVMVDNGAVCTSTSGGAWSSVPGKLEYVGTTQKLFKDWGHCGRCGGGAFRVIARVNVWRYTDGNPEFSTEKHNMFYVYHSEKPIGCGYHWTVTREVSTPYKAFRTEAEYQAWLDEYQGVERPAAWDYSKIVWTRKH